MFKWWKPSDPSKYAPLTEPEEASQISKATAKVKTNYFDLAAGDQIITGWSIKPSPDVLERMEAEARENTAAQRLVTTISNSLGYLTPEVGLLPGMSNLIGGLVCAQLRVQKAGFTAYASPVKPLF